MTGDMKTRDAAPWGSAQWIAAHPWSGTDRRRRRRVLAALPQDFAELLAQDKGHVTWLRALMCKAPAATDRSVRRANRADAAARDCVDSLVADALAKVWGVKR